MEGLLETCDHLALVSHRHYVVKGPEDTPYYGRWRIGMGGGGREGERETETETDRQTDRWTDGQRLFHT